MNNESVQAFLTWWSFSWRWADSSWLQAWADAGVSPHVVESLALSRHQDWLGLLGVAPSQPIEPCPALLQWLALQPAQRVEALRLATRICFPASQQTGEGEHELWCRSLAKALRPGAWIAPQTQADARLVLAAWIAPECWSRLALSWPKAEIQSLEPVPGLWPQRKLDTLWQALLWRVHTPAVPSEREVS